MNESNSSGRVIGNSSLHRPRWLRCAAAPADIRCASGAVDCAETLAGRFALFFAALLCAPLMAASAYATDYGDISVKVETVTSVLSMTGYGECRATIINRSRTKSHRVTIELHSGAYGEAEARRTVEVTPLSTMTIPMVKPEDGFGGGVVRVLIDGSRQEEQAGVDTSRTNAWVSRSVNRFFLLVSSDVEKSGLMNEAARTRSRIWPTNRRRLNGARTGSGIRASTA